MECLVSFISKIIFAHCTLSSSKYTTHCAANCTIAIPASHTSTSSDIGRSMWWSRDWCHQSKSCSPCLPPHVPPAFLAQTSTADDIQHSLLLDGGSITSLRTNRPLQPQSNDMGQRVLTRFHPAHPNSQATASTH
eukprot:scaffold66649_cov36-Cyclotella_meneghiniana.AAC.1